MNTRKARKHAIARLLEKQIQAFKNLLYIANKRGDGKIKTGRRRMKKWEKVTNKLAKKIISLY